MNYVKLFLISGCLSFPAKGLEHNFYVTPAGKDTHSGSLEAPFRTIRHARDTIRPLLAAGETQIVRIHLKGDFSLEEPLVFTPEDGGRDDCLVIYQGIGTNTLIHGGHPLTEWKAVDDTWQTPLPEGLNPRDLYVQDQRATRARHPDTGWLRIDEAAADNRTGFTFHAGELPESLTPAKMELVFLHDWSISRIPVQTIDDATRSLTTAFPIGCQAKHYAMTHFEKHPRYALENHWAFLDAPGEWLLDTESRILHVVGKTAPKRAVVPVATSLIEIRGKPDQPVRNLHFRGLHFAYTHWPLPPQGYASGQAAVHERRDGSPRAHQRIFVPPAILADHAEHLHFEHCTLRNLGGSGIWLRTNCRDSTLIDNQLFDIAANGIMIGEGVVAPALTSSDIQISRNEIHHCGARFYGAVGILAGVVKKIKIEHNHLHQLPYTGISLGWKWDASPTPAADNLVASNHIHHCMQLLSDGGGIYTLGRQPGSKLTGNRIHDIPLNAGKAESNGMFLDQGSSGFTIANNTIYGLDRSPLRFHQAGTNTVQRNTLTCPEGVDPVRYNNTPKENILLLENQIK